MDKAARINDIIHSFGIDTHIPSAAGDKLRLDHSIFAALSLSAFSDENFVLGTKALEADDKLIYDQASGILSFDADGSAAGTAIPIADLGNAAALHFKDFVLI